MSRRVCLRRYSFYSVILYITIWVVRCHGCTYEECDVNFCETSVKILKSTEHLSNHNSEGKFEIKIMLITNVMSVESYFSCITTVLIKLYKHGQKFQFHIVATIINISFFIVSSTEKYSSRHNDARLRWDWELSEIQVWKQLIFSYIREIQGS